MSKVQAKDFYTPTPYNQDTKNQMWMSMIADSHDICCDCNGPFAHLLASIFPEGHRDRDLTINQILIRDYKECLSGGEEEESHGIPVGGSAATAAAATGVKVEDHLEERRRRNRKNYSPPQEKKKEGKKKKTNYTS